MKKQKRTRGTYCVTEKNLEVKPLPTEMTGEENYVIILHGFTGDLQVTSGDLQVILLSH